MFSTSTLKESWASAYFWQCQLVMIGWSIWWSFISKRSLPKLWVLMTSSYFYGDISSMSPNLSMNNQIWPPIKIWKLNINWIFPYFEISSPPLRVKIMAPLLMTWKHFLEVRLRSCVESWVEEKATLYMIFSVTYYLDLHSAIPF